MINLVFFLTLLFSIIILIIVIRALGNLLPRAQKCILYVLPKGILFLTIIYMVVCYYELFVFLDTNNPIKESPITTFLKVFSHKDTYTAMVNFFALLTFYQLLEDRYQKVYSKSFNKLSSLEVITKDVHNQILANERKKVEKVYKAKIKKLQKNK